MTGCLAERRCTVSNLWMCVRYMISEPYPCIAFLFSDVPEFRVNKI